ncbi:hypothetical protein CPC16_010837, partial [Podila verticillata]
ALSRTTVLPLKVYRNRRIHLCEKRPVALVLHLNVSEAQLRKRALAHQLFDEQDTRVGEFLL